MTWNWQQPDWPHFRWDSGRLVQAEQAFLLGTGVIAGTSEHLSDTERNSADAERDSKDVKLYAFLKAQLQTAKPPSYPALVIEVCNFGFFVDVPGLALSGLVHLSSLEDDFYVFEAERNQLVGRRGRRVIQLGDRLEVQVTKVDSFKKQVDFRLAGAGGNASAQTAWKRKPKPDQRRIPAVRSQQHDGKPGRRR